MIRPRALDLFCCAGGAAMGLHRGGFDVVGVDIRPQPHYPFRYVQADALRPPFDLASFTLIWASPPCQRYTRVWRGRDAERTRYPDLVDATRRMLSGHPCTVLENVPGAPLRADLILTGAQFGLPLIRARLFELHGFRVPLTLAHPHAGTVAGGQLACVAGHGANSGWNEMVRNPGITARTPAAAQRPARMERSDGHRLDDARRAGAGDPASLLRAYRPGSAERTYHDTVGSMTQRHALSERNAAIVAQRSAPPPLLPSQFPPHPRDVRLAQLRAAAQTAALNEATPSTERLLALLRSLADAGEPLPSGTELAQAIDVTAYEYNKIVMALKRKGKLVTAADSRHSHRLWCLSDGRELRSAGCPSWLRIP